MAKGLEDITASIIGVGKVGTRILYEILDIDEISKVNIINRDVEKSEKIGEKAKLVGSKTGIQIEVYPFDYMEKAVENSDITITSVCAIHPYSDREKQLEPNMQLTEKIAYAHKNAGFNGTAIIVTNPTDELAYYFSSITKRPFNTVGMNNLDSYRFSYFVKEQLRQNEGIKSPVEAYVIGPHRENLFVPLISNLLTKEGISLANYLKSHFIVKGFGEKEIPRKVNEILEQITNDFMSEFGDTSEETGKATKEVIDAIIKQEGKVVGVSSYIQEQDIFIGWPSCFKGFEAFPLTIKDFEHPFSDSEWDRIKHAYDFLENNLDKLKIRGKLRGIERSKDYELAEILEKEREEKSLLRKKQLNYDKQIQELEKKLEEEKNARVKAEKISENVGAISGKVEELERKIDTLRELEIKVQKITQTKPEVKIDILESYANEILEANKDIISFKDGEGVITNALKLYYGYKERDYFSGRDEWKSGEFTGEPEIKGREFKEAEIGEYYKSVRLPQCYIESVSKSSLWQLYQKTSDSTFKGIFHTNNEEYATSFCNGKCNDANCDRPRGHVNEWRIGIAHEIWKKLEEKLK